MLNKYLKRVKEGVDNQGKRKRGRTRKNNLIVTIIELIFFICAASCQQIEVSGKYYFCEKTNNIWEHPMIDMDTFCRTPKHESKLIALLTPNNYTGYLWIKAPHQVEGPGFQCSRYTVTVKTFKNFWGTESSEVFTQHENLNREDCLEMNRTRKISSMAHQQNSIIG
jgi:hypothetical protein